jgi:pyrimidine deaminase RibD-like protein
MATINKPAIAPNDHLSYLRLALALSRFSPPKPTNYRVGAVLVSSASNTILSTGFTLELPGNTHAEQCCLQKLASKHDVLEENVGDAILDDAVLYTTMEPCNFRLSGNLPCVDRILRAKKIKKVYVGVKEPETLVKENEGRKRLEEAVIEYVHVPGLEQEILEVATAGHEKKEDL